MSVGCRNGVRPTQLVDAQVGLIANNLHAARLHHLLENDVDELHIYVHYLSPYRRLQSPNGGVRHRLTDMRAINTEKRFEQISAKGAVQTFAVLS